MKEFIAIFSNISLIASMVAWFFAQLIKFLISFYKNDKPNWGLFMSTGGFPSSHVATVGALATSIGLNFGFDSGLFAIAIIMTSVVISDARGIRQAAGKQAKALNQIIEDLYQNKGLKMERLKELLGHTSLEIFGGAILGTFIAILFNI
ncbi:MAG: divergent PAP2 family protein [Patescibacteria group bacterium]|nr:divergent PAP2 family protein [Patescibacteria group bacterium]MBU1877245.1 divergent PAP2 family protein [Patescibacteria group bacterium]